MSRCLLVPPPPPPPPPPESGYPFEPEVSVRGRCCRLSRSTTVLGGSKGPRCAPHFIELRHLSSPKDIFLEFSRVLHFFLFFFLPPPLPLNEILGTIELVNVRGNASLSTLVPELSWLRFKMLTRFVLRIGPALLPPPHSYRAECEVLSQAECITRIKTRIYEALSSRHLTFYCV